jgi:hypothetical protein
MNALMKAAAGDPDKKVSVTKAWLTEVHRELRELERLRACQSIDHAFDDVVRAGDVVFKKMDSLFDRVFSRKLR